eukprot:365942-Chlamydomonas_euryale.AAC.91
MAAGFASGLVGHLHRGRARMHSGTLARLHNTRSACATRLRPARCGPFAAACSRSRFSLALTYAALWAFAGPACGV